VKETVMAEMPEISMGDAMKSITIQVKVTRKAEWAVRIWLGVQLFRLGALVMGCKCSAEIS
jgi:hypothetical protein